MPGRGAWPSSGAGGTLNLQGTGPGGYYRMPATGSVTPVGSAGWGSSDPNKRAVHGGVIAIQRALNRRVPAHKIKATGVFDHATQLAVERFQRRRKIDVSGVVGPTTAQALFTPDIRHQADKADFPHWSVVCGLIKNESAFDPGAVGYADQTDLGLAQINGPAHPDWDEKERLKPLTAIRFVQDYLTNALRELDNLDDAIASYNLGIGGARTWIRAGRPGVWTPSGSSTARNVAAYIARIKTACAE